MVGSGPAMLFRWLNELWLDGEDCAVVEGSTARRGSVKCSVGADGHTGVHAEAIGAVGEGIDHGEISPRIDFKYRCATELAYLRHYGSTLVGGAVDIALRIEGRGALRPRAVAGAGEGVKCGEGIGVCQFKDRAASGRLPYAVGSLMGSARGGGPVEIAGTISGQAGDGIRSIRSAETMQHRLLTTSEVQTVDRAEIVFAAVEGSPVEITVSKY